MKWFFVIIFVLVFFLELLFDLKSGKGLNINVSGQTLLHMGAMTHTFTSQLEIWRILSSMFLHLNLIHLLMNSMAFYSIGKEIEELFGNTKLTATFIISAIMGSLSSVIVHLCQSTHFIEAGASGGIYGMFGLLYFTSKKYSDCVTPQTHQQLNVMLFILIVFSFAPGIGTWAHLGGLLTGIGLGYWYMLGIDIHQYNVQKNTEYDFSGTSQYWV